MVPVDVPEAALKHCVTKAFHPSRIAEQCVPWWTSRSAVRWGHRHGFSECLEISFQTLSVSWPIIKFIKLRNYKALLILIFLKLNMQYHLF